MLKWFQGKKEEPAHINTNDADSVMAAYSDVLARVYEEYGHEGIFDVNELPCAKEVFKLVLKETVASDPEDEGLKNCYLSLAQFQALPTAEISEKEAEELWPKVEKEKQQLLNELE